MKASAKRYIPAKGSTLKTATISSHFRRTPIMPPSNAVTSAAIAAAIRTGTDVKKPPIVVSAPVRIPKAPLRIEPSEAASGPNLAMKLIICGK